MTVRVEATVAASTLDQIIFGWSLTNVTVVGVIVIVCRGIFIRIISICIINCGRSSFLLVLLNLLETLLKKASSRTCRASTHSSSTLNTVDAGIAIILPGTTSTLSAAASVVLTTAAAMRETKLA